MLIGMIARLAAVAAAFLVLSLGVAGCGGGGGAAHEAAVAAVAAKPLASGLSGAMRGAEASAALGFSSAEIRVPWRWLRSWGYLGPRALRAAKLTGGWIGTRVNRVAARIAHESDMSWQEAKEVNCIWLEYYLEEGNTLPSREYFESAFYEYVEDRLWPWTQYADIQGAAERLYDSIVEGEGVSYAAVDLTLELTC